MDPIALATIKSVLERNRIAYFRTKTWTTDAIYRETPEKAAATELPAAWPLKWKLQLFLLLQSSAV